MKERGRGWVPFGTPLSLCLSSNPKRQKNVAALMSMSKQALLCFLLQQMKRNLPMRNLQALIVVGGE